MPDIIVLSLSEKVKGIILDNLSKEDFDSVNDKLSNIIKDFIFGLSDNNKENFTGKLMTKLYEIPENEIFVGNSEIKSLVEKVVGDLLNFATTSPQKWVDRATPSKEEQFNQNNPGELTWEEKVRSQGSSKGKDLAA